MTEAKRVAVVTDEFVGINKGGGIGTCARTLSHSLARAGFDVDVIITDLDYASKDGEFQHFRVKGIREAAKAFGYDANDCIKRAYVVYQILSGDDYEAVHFNDWRGSGYFYALAKRQGLVDSAIVTHLHGPSKWTRAYNLTLLDIDTSELEALEKSQIENSDLVLSPSQYLIDWYRDEGVKLPASKVINWQLPDWTTRSFAGGESRLSTRAVGPGEISEIIFFGRQERRKGFREFLEAVASRPKLKHMNLIFLGRFDKIDGEFTGSMVYRILPRHVGTISFINHFGHGEAMDFLKSRPRALVVMPSQIENSPCTVGECFTIGIPFVATRVGGTPELFQRGASAPNLVGNSAFELGAKLEDIIVSGLESVESVLHPSSIADQWLELHKIINTKTASRAVPDRPRVSVCLVHHNRTHLLRRALLALAEQTYDNFEVVLVDDGSDERAREDLKQIEGESWNFELRVVFSQNRYLGAARNLAVEHATGEFVIFHDDDNVSEPNQIEIFVKAALIGNYDVLTCQYLVFEDEKGPASASLRYFSIGLGGPFSWLRNRFGDANALVRTSTFKAVGGFSELKKVGWEDWEFFLRCFVHGARLGFVPIPLFRYRVSTDGMLATSDISKNHKRIADFAHEAHGHVPAELVEFSMVDFKNRATFDHAWNRLGHIEHAELHRELMNLEPNSDAAREKLMELNFALGRYSDAVELGLRLHGGYHRVSKILDTLLPRFQTLGRVVCFEPKISVLKTDAVLLVGWIDYQEKRLLPRELRIGDKNYQVEVVKYQSRKDVNDFLGRPDLLDRGVNIIGSPDERRTGSITVGNHVEISSSAGPYFEVELETLEIDLSPIVIRCSGLPDQPAHRAFVERVVAGSLCSLDVGQAPGPWLNRIQISAELPCLAYIMLKEDFRLQEIIFDENGNSSLNVTDLNKNILDLNDIKDLRLFIAAGSGRVEVALTPVL